jgi:thiosulfate reductase cytochrome b subunit
MLLLDPNLMSPFVSYIGMENMKYVFIVHLAGAFGMVAYLLGHLYLGTTGDRIAQHYKVMITGQHDEYQRKSPETVQKQS